MAFTLNTPVADLQDAVAKEGQKEGFFAKPNECTAYSQHIDVWIAANPGITVGQWITKALLENNEFSLMGFAVIACTKKIRKLYDDEALAAMLAAGACTMHGAMIIRQTFGDDLPDGILAKVKHLDNCLGGVRKHKKFSEQAD